MKKILLLAFLLVSVCTGAQTNQNEQHKNITDSLLLRIDSLLDINNKWIEHIELNMSLKQRYKLYPTDNLYTFLELDTKTGMIKQVQWSPDDEKEGTFIINSSDLTYGWGEGSGTFELYPTKNMYQFILLNKTNGNKWHVQWGIGDAKRWIRRIR